jgi:hypothetical protein
MNDLVKAVIMIFGFSYVAVIREDPPKYIHDLFKNDIFRVLFLFLLLAHGFRKSPSISILVSLVFVYTMHLINEAEIKENFGYIDGLKRMGY